MVSRSGKKKEEKNKISIWSSEFVVLCYHSDVVSMFSDPRVPVFATQLTINIDFYLYVKHSIS